jgi:hypothetical protein
VLSLVMLLLSETRRTVATTGAADVQLLPAKAPLQPVLPPPQAARARAASAVIQRNVRIVFTWAIDP